MKIAITGICGFVGSVLTRQLLNLGYEIRGMDNFYRNGGDSLIDLASNPNLEFFKGNICEYNDCKRLCKDVDFIIHLASLVGEPISKHNKQLAWLVNLEGTKNIVNANLNKIPIIYSSTGSIYGKITEICTEKTIPNPVSEYGLSKLAAETEVVKQTNSIALRYATGAGISNNIRLDLLINDFVYQAVKNKILNIAEADVKRTFISVTDMGLAICHCIQNYEKVIKIGQIFNVGDESLNLTKRELVNYIQKRTNCIVHYDEFMKDGDARDYAVDYSLFKSTGWKITKNIETILDELLRSIPLIYIDSKYHQKI